MVDSRSGSGQTLTVDPGLDQLNANPGQLEPIPTQPNSNWPIWAWSDPALDDQPQVWTEQAPKVNRGLQRANETRPTQI